MCFSVIPTDLIVSVIEKDVFASSDAHVVC